MLDFLNIVWKIVYILLSTEVNIHGLLIFVVFVFYEAALKNKTTKAFTSAPSPHFIAYFYKNHIRKCNPK